MDNILNTVGKDCFGLIMEYAKMKDEFDMCITQLNKKSVTTDLNTCFHDYHMEHYFEDDADEYYYPFVYDGEPDYSYVEFVYFMEDLKEYKKIDVNNHFSRNICKSLKTMKKLI